MKMKITKSINVNVYCVESINYEDEQTWVAAEDMKSAMDCISQEGLESSGGIKIYKVSPKKLKELEFIGDMDNPMKNPIPFSKELERAVKKQNLPFVLAYSLV